MRAFWRDYNLSIVLFAMFIVSWVLQGVAQWFEVANEATAHGESSTLVDWVPAFLAATFENWQSEFVQLFTFVVLTSFLIHKGSHESKDSDEEMKATLGRIEERLKRLERGEAWPRVTHGWNGNGHVGNDQVVNSLVGNRDIECGLDRYAREGAEPGARSHGNNGHVANHAAEARAGLTLTARGR